MAVVKSRYLAFVGSLPGGGYLEGPVLSSGELAAEEGAFLLPPGSLAETS